MTSDLIREAIRRGILADPLRERVFAKAAQHQKQFDFLKSPAKWKAIKGGRRGGKTVGICLFLILGALRYPGIFNPYISLTRTHAKSRMWEPMRETLHELDLPFVENKTDLQLRLWNGSVLWLAGCESIRDVDKFRGNPYGHAAVDEAGFYGNRLRSLIVDALQPGLMDVNGCLGLSGSPGYTLDGFFFEVTTEDRGWELWEWTAVDNPFVKDVEEYFEAILKQNRWDSSNPTFQREYLGRWVQDIGSLVYPYARERNWFATSPNLGWTRFLVVDLGSTGSTAFVVGGWCVDSPHVLVWKAWKQADLTPTEMAGIIKRTMAEYRCQKCIVDAGGLGGGYVNEFRKHHDVPVLPADKVEKPTWVRLLREAIMAGLVKIVGHQCDDLIDELAVLPWDKAQLLPAKGGPIEDHLADALLYLYRACKPYLYEGPSEIIVPGSQQWYAALEEQKLQATIDAQNKKRRWWKR